MTRSVAFLTAVLKLVAPSFEPRDEAAAELRELAKKHQLDPLTIVAVVERESGWDPRAIGKLGEVGLGQVMPSNNLTCRTDGAACQEHKAALLDWRINLRETARLMAAHRAYCERVVGSSLAIYWLQEYQGVAGTCGHVRRLGRWEPKPVPKGVYAVLDRRRELARRRK